MHHFLSSCLSIKRGALVFTAWISVTERRRCDVEQWVSEFKGNVSRLSVFIRWAKVGRVRIEREGLLLLHELQCREQNLCLRLPDPCVNSTLTRRSFVLVVCVLTEEMRVRISRGQEQHQCKSVFERRDLKREETAADAGQQVLFSNPCPRAFLSCDKRR